MTHFSAASHVPGVWRWAQEAQEAQVQEAQLEQLEQLEQLVQFRVRQREEEMEAWAEETEETGKEDEETRKSDQVKHSKMALNLYDILLYYYYYINIINYYVCWTQLISAQEI